MIFLSSPRTTFPAHLIAFALTNLIIEDGYYKYETIRYAIIYILLLLIPSFNNHFSSTLKS